MSLVSPKIAHILRELEDAALDLSDAKTSPREIYVDPEWYAFEQEAIFGRSWLCVGRVDCVKKPGDYVRIDIGDEPLVIVKGDDGDIRVLSAVCAHRGHIVCEGSGNCGKVLRCPLHHWSYALDGRLITAPSMSETIPLEELKREAFLTPLKVELWNGFIFANMDPDAAPLAPGLWRLEKDLENYHLDEMVIGAGHKNSEEHTTRPPWESDKRPWNWKVMVENGLEPYHTAYIHMGNHDFAHVRYASFFSDWEDDEQAVYHPTGFTHIDANFTPTTEALFPIIPTLTEKDRSRAVLGMVPPTLFFAAFPDVMVYTLILPTGPETHARTGAFCFPPDSLKVPLFEERLHAYEQFLFGVSKDDNIANESQQRGYRARLRRPGPRYSYQEETLVHFNRWLLKGYRSYVERVSDEEATGVAG